MNTFGNVFPPTPILVAGARATAQPPHSSELDTKYACDQSLKQTLFHRHAVGTFAFRGSKRLGYFRFVSPQ
jgi:hypothetical protein